ncbi:MAG: hypothetical protein ACRDFS_11830 [Chloroflexota bacterium]
MAEGVSETVFREFLDELERLGSQDRLVAGLSKLHEEQRMDQPELLLSLYRQLAKG